MIKNIEDYLQGEIDFLLKILTKSREGSLLLAVGEKDDIKAYIIKLYTRLYEVKANRWLKRTKVPNEFAAGERILGADGVEYIALVCGTLVPIYDSFFDDIVVMILAAHNRDQRYTYPST